MYFSSRCSPAFQRAKHGRFFGLPELVLLLYFSNSPNILYRLCVVAADLRVLEAYEIDAVLSRIGTLEKSSYFEVLLLLSSQRQC
jgi:hypothetical protein